MINLEKHTINLGTGDVGVQILQGGSIENPVPVFAFYNLSNEEQRVLMGFSGVSIIRRKKKESWKIHSSLILTH